MKVEVTYNFSNGLVEKEILSLEEFENQFNTDGFAFCTIKFIEE